MMMIWRWWWFHHLAFLSSFISFYFILFSVFLFSKIDTIFCSQLAVQVKVAKRQSLRYSFPRVCLCVCKMSRQFNQYLGYKAKVTDRWSKILLRCPFTAGDLLGHHVAASIKRNERFLRRRNWPSSLVCGSVPLSASSMVPGSLWGLSLRTRRTDGRWETPRDTTGCSVPPTAHSPVLLAAGHALLVHWAIQLALVGKDDLVVDDDGFDDLVDWRLACDRVLAVRDGHQGRAKADGQIVGIHHVLVAVLGETEGRRHWSHSASIAWNGWLIYANDGDDNAL